MITELASPLDAGDADFSYGDMLIFRDDGRILRRFSLPDYSFEACFSDWYLCGVAKLYKTKLHARWGYYDETLLAHDHELFLRFAVNGVRFFHVPRALMGVRDHDEGRQIHIHDPANWNRLYEESKELVKQARQMHQTG